MNFSKSIHFSFILLLIFSTIMTIAGIRGFLRLAPSIEYINKHNTNSLYYSEQMLSSISVNRNLTNFESALHNAEKNVTESGEASAVKNIKEKYQQAFNGDKASEEVVINNIIELSKINRVAMHQAGMDVKQLSSVGIWVIVFLTLIIWVLGFAIIKSINKTVILPLFELQGVIEAYRKGNRMRRCPKLAPSREFQQIYDGINMLLDNTANS